MFRLVATLLTAAFWASTAHATDLVSSPLAGATWEVTAIDGLALEPSPSDDGRVRLPQFSFGYRTYGGNVGCNALGGLYAQLGPRFYTMPGPQTQMACGGARGRQESAANALLSASPSVVRTQDTAVLSGGGHRMDLRRLGAAGAIDGPEAWQSPTIAGQSFVIHAVNGAATEGMRIWSKSPPQLAFGDTRVTMRLDCPGERSGSFVLGSEYAHIDSLKPACTSPSARDAQLAAILNADPRTVSGPNGELLLASAEGWAILWNARTDRPK